MSRKSRLLKTRGEVGVATLPAPSNPNAGYTGNDIGAPTIPNAGVATRLGLEIGAHGTPIFSGIITEDFNSKFVHLSDALKIYDEMRRTDGTIQAMLLALEMPILAAEYTVHPASEDEQDVKIARFIQWNLFDGMTTSFREFLRQSLTMLWAGFSIFEKVFEFKDWEGERFIGWRKLAQRLQNTVQQWVLDDNGGPAGFIQQAPPKYIPTPIPIEKLLLFTNRKEGGNLQGMSLLRAVYKHWYFKDRLYRLQAIGLERDVVGVPTIELPPNASAKDQTKAKDIVTSIRRDERAGVVYPSTWKFMLKGLAGSPTSAASDFMRAIAHHDMQCAKAVLAQFINLGGGGPGSYALSVEQMSLMVLAEEAIVNYITDIINNHAVKQLVDLNWPGYEKYPNLRAGRISRQDIRTAAANLSLLARGGLIQIDPSILNWVRREFGLPEQLSPEEPTGEFLDVGNMDINELARQFNLVPPYSPIRVSETENLDAGGQPVDPNLPTPPNMAGAKLPAGTLLKVPRQPVRRSRRRGIPGTPSNKPDTIGGGGTGTAQDNPGAFSRAR